METRSKRRRQEQATVSTIQELDRVIGDCDHDGVKNAFELVKSHPEVKERWLKSLSERFGFEYYDVEDIEELALEWATASKVFTDIVNANIALNDFKSSENSSFEHSMKTHLIQNMKFVIEELMYTNPLLLSSLCSDQFQSLFGCSVWEAYVIYTGVFIGEFVPKQKKAMFLLMSVIIHQATFCPVPKLKNVMEDIIQKMVKNTQVNPDTIGLMLAMIASSKSTMSLQQCVKRTLNNLEANAKLAICKSFINHMNDVELALEDQYCNPCGDFFMDWSVHCEGLQIEMVQTILHSLDYSPRDAFVLFLNAFFDAKDVLKQEQVPPHMPNLSMLLQMYDKRWNINTWCELINEWHAIFPDRNPTIGIDIDRYEFVEMDGAGNVFVDNFFADNFFGKESHYILNSGNKHFINMPRVPGECHSALLHIDLPACVQHKNAHMLVLPTLKEARRINFFENHIMAFPKWIEEVVGYFYKRGLIFGKKEYNILMDKLPDVAMRIKSLFSSS